MADPSKTEQATPRRRSELQNKGQVARSQEFSAAVLFILAIVFLRLYLPALSDYLQASTGDLWSDFPRQLDINSFMGLMTRVVGGIFIAMAPLFGGLMLAGILVNLVQVGFHPTLYPLRPDLAKLNPINGFKRLFSLQPTFQLLMNLVKIAIFIWLSWSILESHYTQLLQSVQLDLDEIGKLLGSIIWEIGWKIGLVMFLLACGDLAWQRWYYERNIRMSKQEIKDEHRNTEGDPQIKSKIRQMQRKAAMNRMMDAIPRADVILTNPIHLAVAVAYDREEMNAPQVLAKGASAVAERIKERAREHEIPIIENKELARALFRTTEVGQEIPGDLYAAVSEVLIYVYQLSGKLEDYLD